MTVKDSNAGLSAIPKGYHPLQSGCRSLLHPLGALKHCLHCNRVADHTEQDTQLCHSIAQHGLLAVTAQMPCAQHTDVTFQFYAQNTAGTSSVCRTVWLQLENNHGACQVASNRGPHSPPAHNSSWIMPETECSKMPLPHLHCALPCQHPIQRGRRANAN